MNNPIKTKSLDKVRENAIRKSTQNVDFTSVVQGTADSLIFTTGREMKIAKFKKHYSRTFPVGEGWRPLVEKLVDDIIEIDPTVEVSQVKEKYGGLRFYIWGGTDEIYALIEKAEKESYKICENCGTREGVKTKGGWLLTLCDKCRKELEKC